MIRRRLIFFCGVSISLGPCGGFDGVLRHFFIILIRARWVSAHRVVCCLGDSILFRAIFLCMIMLVIKVRLIVSRRELVTPFDLCCQYSAASFLMMKAKVGKRALWIDSNMNCSRA